MKHLIAACSRSLGPFFPSIARHMFLAHFQELKSDAAPVPGRVLTKPELAEMSNSLNLEKDQAVDLQATLRSQFATYAKRRVLLRRPKGRVKWTKKKEIFGVRLSAIRWHNPDIVTNPVQRVDHSYDVVFPLFVGELNETKDVWNILSDYANSYEFALHQDRIILNDDDDPLSDIEWWKGLNKRHQLGDSFPNCVYYYPGNHPFNNSASFVKTVARRTQADVIGFYQGNIRFPRLSHPGREYPKEDTDFENAAIWGCKDDEYPFSPTKNWTPIRGNKGENGEDHIGPDIH